MAKKKLQAAPLEQAKAQLQECWAFAKFYEPFILGGDVWPRKKYKVMAEPITVGKASCFIFFDEKYTKEWRLHEATTGGHLDSGTDRDALIAKIKQLLKETPDFAEQVAAYGSPTDLEEIDTDRALERLSKSTEVGR